jgi:Transposase DDE domain
MSHQDRHARGVRGNSVDLLKALQWLMAGINWSHVSFRGDCTWTSRWLAAAALLWAWSDESTLKERFFCAQRLIIHLQTDTKSVTSYQAFVKSLKRWTSSLVQLLKHAFRQRMIETFADRWTIHGFVVFGVDGSRVELPRTKSNERAYAFAKPRSQKVGRGRRKKLGDASAEKKARGPQLWLTTLFHVGLHLPWDWRIGPSDSSERAQALEMLEGLPQQALLTGDAGFVGYDFTRTVLERGAELLVRVGSNVTLLKQLGYVRESAGTVCVWPDKAARKGQPPLVFRMIVVQGPKHPLYLIVSVRDRNRLSDRQVAELYRARWGIEVFYRHLKQTFGRRKLRSHSAENARSELEWSVIGLWGMGLYASAELVRQELPLERLSMAGVLKAFRSMARDYLHPVDRQATLPILLRRALIDGYPRKNRTSRAYPRQKRYRPAGKPNIEAATPFQQHRAQSIKKKG